MDCDELNVLLTSTIAKVVEGKAVCFALSGGVDSTLLTAIAVRQRITSPVVAYTAVTGAGCDLGYAEQAADVLGIKLRRITVPTGHAALDFFDAMSARAGEPLDLVGNSIGFAAICAAAKADEFDAIVDGTGAEQRIFGNIRIAATWIHLAKQAGRDDLIAAFAARNGPSFMRHVRRHSPIFASMAEALNHDLTKSKFTYWRDHHRVTARATGLEIISPFLEPELRRLANQPLEWYCPDGWLKSPLRRLLSRHIGDAIAYRPDNQGLRWPRRLALAGCRSRMRRKIARSGALASCSVRDRASFHFRVKSINGLARLYQAATGLDREYHGEESLAGDSN